MQENHGYPRKNPQIHSLCHQRPSPKSDEEKWWIFFRELGFAGVQLRACRVEDSVQRVTSAGSGARSDRAQSLVFIYSLGQARGGEGERRGGEGRSWRKPWRPGGAPARRSIHQRLLSSSAFQPPARTARGVSSCARSPLSCRERSRNMRQIRT